ncbi:MAG: DUF3078 domain-containing protein, partial [bacterium]
MRTLTFALIAFICMTTMATDAATCERAADLALSLTQSNYNSHWTGGEAGSVNWIGNANLNATGKFSEIFSLKEDLKLSFGQTHTQNKDTKEWAKPEKSSDRIFLESVGLFTLGGLFDPYASVTFESQFLDASVSEVNRYVNPITLNESVGLSRTFFADTLGSTLASRLGLALQHFSDNRVVDIATATKERSTVTSGGMSWVTDFSQLTRDKRLKYVTKLRVFWAWFNSESDNLATNDWKTPDLAWEHTLSAAITKLLQVQLFLEFQYDKEIDKAMRFKETLALGLSYKLF